MLASNTGRYAAISMIQFKYIKYNKSNLQAEVSQFTKPHLYILKKATSTSSAYG